MSVTPTSLRSAIEHGQRVLLETQHPDGSWDERSDVGPMSTAMVLVALHWLGALPPGDLSQSARWLRLQQAADGSFPGSPYAREGDLSATALAWAALQLAESDEHAHAIARARDFVEARGGIEALLDRMRTGDVTPVFLAMAGLLDAARLPDPGQLWARIPGVVEFVAKRVHFGIVMGALQLSLLARRLRGDYGADGTHAGAWARWERTRAAELVLLYQNPDGSWNSNTVQTAMALPALVAAGFTVDSDPVARGIAWLKSRRVTTPEGVWFDVFASDVWSTAFSVRALLRSGIAPGEPSLVRATQWLLSRQLDVPQPWPNNRKKNAIRTGGWPFQTGNVTMADCDDAGIVLSTLALALESPAVGDPLPTALATQVRAAIDRGRAWLVDMQNPDGGWSAFVWGLPPRPRGAIMDRPLDFPPDDRWKMLSALLHPPPELGDPSTEDLTARVLHGLGMVGTEADDPVVARALAFLRTHQTSFGGWWGRWVCNYVASTAYVLGALYEVSEDLDEEYVKHAIRWLLSVQNADGGFGESVASYVDPTQAGRGPSTAPLTALVVQALVDIGHGEHEATQRAIEYLLALQRPDGTWPNGDYLATNIPPEGFYVYTGAARHMPLEALARYAHRHRREAIRPRGTTGRWSSAVLGPARERVDPVADAVVEHIYREGDLEAVNRLMAMIARNDDPIPEALPAVARAYFEDTAALPALYDPTRTAVAQQLFAHHGVQLTFGLFCSSLPQAYCAANGALVLTDTHAMTHRVRERVMETAQFLFDVLDVGGLEPRGRGVRTAQRVRLMHAAVRRLLLARRGVPWPTEIAGMPVNQEDLAGTLMTFSVVTFEAMRRLGVEATDAEGDAWVQHWGVVGHLLGIDPELVPNSLSDGQDLMEAIRQRQWRASAQGSALGHALVDMMQAFFTRGHLDGLAPTLIRFLAGDRCADLLALPPSDWTKTILTVGSMTAAALDRDARDGLLERAFGRAARSAMKAIVAIEREGKGAPFRLPASLRENLLADP